MTGEIKIYFHILTTANFLLPPLQSHLLYSYNPIQTYICTPKKVSNATPISNLFHCSAINCFTPNFTPFPSPSSHLLFHKEGKKNEHVDFDDTRLLLLSLLLFFFHCYITPLLLHGYHYQNNNDHSSPSFFIPFPIVSNSTQLGESGSPTGYLCISLCLSIYLPERIFFA